MTIPPHILSKAKEIYESNWPDPVLAIAEALFEASNTPPAQKAGERDDVGFAISVYSDGVFIREEALDGPSDVIFIKGKHLDNLISSLQQILNEKRETASW